MEETVMTPQVCSKGLGKPPLLFMMLVLRGEVGDKGWIVWMPQQVPCGETERQGEQAEEGCRTLAMRLWRCGVWAGATR